RGRSARPGPAPPQRARAPRAWPRPWLARSAGLGTASPVTSGWRALVARGPPATRKLWTQSRHRTSRAWLPGAPFQRGLAELGRVEEGRRTVQVEQAERGDSRGVAPGQRGQVPLLLDQLEHGGVVEDLAGHEVRPGERGDQDGRHPESVPVVPGWPCGHVLL